MKKKIIISGFLLLILATAICTVVSAEKSYRYDIENNIDIFEGLGAVLAMMFGAIIILYELDLFYTVYYFVIRPKTKLKSVLNVLCNGTFLSVFICFVLSNNLPWSFENIGLIKTLEAASLVLFGVYFVLRFIYLGFSLGNETKKTTM